MDYHTSPREENTPPPSGYIQPARNTKPISERDFLHSPEPKDVMLNYSLDSVDLRTLQPVFDNVSSCHHIPPWLAQTITSIPFPSPQARQVGHPACHDPQLIDSTFVNESTRLKGLGPAMVASVSTAQIDTCNENKIENQLQVESLSTHPYCLEADDIDTRSPNDTLVPYKLSIAGGGLGNLPGRPQARPVIVRFRHEGSDDESVIYAGLGEDAPRPCVAQSNVSSGGFLVQSFSAYCQNPISSPERVSYAFGRRDEVSRVREAEACLRCRLLGFKVTTPLLLPFHCAS